LNTTILCSTASAVILVNFTLHKLILNSRTISAALQTVHTTKIRQIT